MVILGTVNASSFGKESADVIREKNLEMEI
jgi:hypothetical protein